MKTTAMTPDEVLQKLYHNHLTVRELAKLLAALPEEQQDLFFTYNDDGRIFAIPKDEPMLFPIQVAVDNYEATKGFEGAPTATVLLCSYHA